MYIHILVLSIYVWEEVGPVWEQVSILEAFMNQVQNILGSSVAHEQLRSILLGPGYSKLGECWEMLWNVSFKWTFVFPISTFHPESFL